MSALWRPDIPQAVFLIKKHFCPLNILPSEIEIEKLKSKLHETFQNKNKKLKSAHTGAAQAIRKTFQNEIISK